MTDHAPGPWRLERTGSIAVSIYAADNSQVASFDLRYNPTRVEVNARLIAAAPKLLAAAEGLISWYPTHCPICQEESPLHQVMMLTGVPCPFGLLQAAIAEVNGKYDPPAL